MSEKEKIMKGKVRIIALTVAAIMMLCAMPLNAFAEETEQQSNIFGIL